MKPWIPQTEWSEPTPQMNTTAKASWVYTRLAHKTDAQISRMHTLIYKAASKFKKNVIMFIFIPLLQINI